MTYGYIRVSTDKQDVENQKIGINRKAEELGLSIEEWISDEGVSGMKEYNKRNLGILMGKLKEGDVLIISEISRLARSVFMLFRIIELCNERKVVIYSVKDSINTVKPNDLTSMMMLFCFGIAAQIEREMIVKRTKEGLEKRRSEGVVFGRPVGKNLCKDNPKHLAIVEQIKPLIEKEIGVPSIAKLVGISRPTLNYIMNKYGIFSKNNKARQTMRVRWANGEFEKLRSALWKEKCFIEDLIKEGLAPTQISKRLDGIIEGVNPNKVINFINRNPDMRTLMEQRQAEIRSINNKDCRKLRYQRYNQGGANGINGTENN